MKLWMAWLWLLPASMSVCCVVLGFISHEPRLVGHSLLVLAGTLSLAMLGEVSTFPV